MRLPHRPVHLAWMLLVPALLVGCFDAPKFHLDTNGALPPGYTNPYDFDLLFNGTRAHADALRQLFAEPQTQSDPLFRIPGTEDHLVAAMRIVTAGLAAGYDVTWLNFTGAEYYDLDPGAARTWQCRGDSAAQQQGRSRVESLPFHNILLTPRNVSFSGLLLLGHYDTKRFASTGEGAHTEPIPGANDGASEVGALLELARILPEAGHGFLFTDGEDGFEDCHPLAGSLHFARTQASNRGVEAGLLLDMVGDPTARYTKEDTTRTLPGGSAMQDALWSVAAEMNATNFHNRTTRPVTDDHVPLIEEGIPTVDLIDWDPDRDGPRAPFQPYWHTTGDDHTVITPQGLARSGVVVEAYLRLDTWRSDAGLN